MKCTTKQPSNYTRVQNADTAPMANRVKRDVRVEVAPGALGVTFEADYNGCAAVVKQFGLTPAGLESPLAKRIKRGYVLVAIDDMVTTKMRHNEVRRKLQRCVREGKSQQL